MTTGVRVTLGVALLSGATALFGGSIVAAPPSTAVTTTTTAVPTTTTAVPTTTTVAPSATQPEVSVANPTAEVRLGCGRSSSTRTILEFVNNAPVDRQTALLLATQLADGSYRTDRYVVVGDETPADPLLFWHVPGLYEGPWRVDSLVDECSAAGAGAGQVRTTSLAETGARFWASFVAVATGLLGSGMLVLRLSTRRRRPIH